MAAAALAVLWVTGWLAFGANTGWTKTTRTRLEKDPVTDLEYPTIEKQFSPGLEWLVAGSLLAAALAWSSFAFKPKP